MSIEADETRSRAERHESKAIRDYHRIIHLSVNKARKNELKDENE